MHLIFDFDGTLVDSFNCVMEKSMLLAEEYNFRKIDPREIIYLRDLTTKEIIQYLQIPLYIIPQIIYKIRKSLQSEMKKLHPIPHMPYVLEKLHDAGFSMSILTSNSVENVQIWLEEQNLHRFFDSTFIESSFLSKKYVLKKTLRNYRWDRSRLFYIGDETRDIDAAKQNKVDSIAVTWGYNSEKALLQYQPIHIARHPDDLLKILGLITQRKIL